MSSPLISIIVPIYNSEKYLTKCLQSLLNQTLKDIDIICVIDGSTDNSQMICENFKVNDLRIKIFIQENQGPSGARNTGLANAKAKYIQFCDPDDFYNPDTCQIFYNTIIESNADLAVGSINIIYDGVNSQPGDKEYYRIKNIGLNNIDEQVFRTTDVSLCNKIFKKSLIDMYKINFPDGLIYEDACFFYKYLYVCKTIYYIEEKLYNYVRHKNSIMTSTYNKENKIIDHLFILGDINNFLLCNKIDGSLERNIFFWIIISSIQFFITNNLKKTEAASINFLINLLNNFREEDIDTCPFITSKERKILISLKHKNVNLYSRLIFFKYNILRTHIRNLLLPLFPDNSKRRTFLRKIIA